MTEVTTTEVKEPTAYEVAAEFVKNNAVSEITERIAKQSQEIEMLRKDKSDNWTRYKTMYDKVEEFLIEHIGDNNVDVDDLKELAEELNIELTKDVEVTFKVDVKYSGTVPLDFDMDKITEDMFDIRISFSSDNSDVDLDEDYADIEDFETEEN